MLTVSRHIGLGLLLLACSWTAHAQWLPWRRIPSPPAPIASEPFLAGDNSQRLSVFVVTADGAVYQSAQDPANAAFGPWKRLSPPGLVLAASSETNRIAVAKNQDGRLEVFAWNKNGDKLAHMWQITPGGQWSAWVDIEPPSPQWSGADLFAGSNSDGRLEVFVKNGFNSQLFHTWQVAPNGGWESQWHNLQGPPASLQISGKILWQQNADGRQEVFARSNSDDQVWSVAQDQANDGWRPWARSTASGGPKSNPFAVLQNQDGRLELFSRPTIDLWNAWQTSPGEWGSAWANLGSPPGVVPTLAFVRLANGRLAAYSWSTTGLYEITQVAPNSGWNDWKLALPGILDSTSGHPSALFPALDQNNQTVLVALASGRLFVTRAAAEAGSDRLHESVTIEGKRLAVVFDFDTDSCYPSSAIYPNGAVNPGLEEQSSGLTAGCREPSQIGNSNTYYRKATIINNGVVYATHMYALYFMKDKSIATPVDAIGHRHDWEYALVWTTNGVMTHVSYSRHGGVTTEAKSSLALDDGGHVKIVYHKDGGFTHAFRLGLSGEQAENHMGRWVTPVIVDWKTMNGLQASNEKLRQTLNAYNFDEANCSVSDYIFPHEIAKSPPADYPSGSEWKAAAMNQ